MTSKSFKMPPQMDELKTNWAQTKTYDKIAWANRRSFSFTGRCNVVPFKNAVYQEKRPKGGKKQISDHLPLWAEFNVNKLSQQLDQIINRRAAT